MLRKMILLLTIVAALGVSSVFAAGGTTTLNLDISGLSDLGETAVYEGWLIVDGAPVSTGVFSIDGTGTNQSFTVASDYADKAAAFVLTIEPANDPDPAPSSIHPIAGSFANGVADLSVGHPAALGSDFANAGGGYILAAPSGDDAAYYNGFWFLQDGAASLDLPTLPEGWAYEGWVVDENGPVSTGTFTDVAAADSDGGGATAGSNPTPPFPGQDFVSPPVNLIGKTIVVSIEPVPDNSPAPFDYKPLLDVTIDDVGEAGGFQTLQQNLGSLATGTAVFVEGVAADASQPAANSSATTGDSVAVFNTPVGADGPGALLPGSTYEVTFDANKGQSLHLATMLVQTNDYFFSPNEWGIALYDEDGNAKSGDVTDYVHLWDAGTELNERPGSGIYQAPRQTGPNTGSMDVNAKVRRAHDNYSVIPAVNQLINVTLTHNGGTNFTISIANVSGSSSFASPLAPGVVLVTDQVAPIFQNQFFDRGLGLEQLAEDGNAAILADNLK